MQVYTVVNHFNHVILTMARIGIYYIRNKNANLSTYLGYHIPGYKYDNDIKF